MDIEAVTAFRVVEGKLAEELWSQYDLPSVGKLMAAAIVQRYVEEVWTRGDLNAIDELTADGFVLHDESESIDIDRRQLGARVREWRDRNPGARLAVSAYPSGDWGEVVARRWSVKDNRGEIVGSGMAISRLTEGKIAEEWSQEVDARR